MKEINLIQLDYNGYYVDLKNYNNPYITFQKHLDFVLIGYNYEAGKDIVAHQTIAPNGVELLSKFFSITHSQSYLILKYYDKNAKRFFAPLTPQEITGRNILIINYDKIACSNFNEIITQ